MSNKFAIERLRRQINEGLGELKEFDVFYDTFLWNWYCSLRKLGRFIRRLYIWMPTLWKIENWSDYYLIDVIELQLKEMEKAFREDELLVESDKKAKQVRIVLEHIKRYRDIGKYTIDTDVDEFLNNFFFEPCGDGFSTMKHHDEKLNEKHYRIHKAKERLETWHFQEIFRRIEKYSRRWSI